jgi:hypothetical protein
VEALPEASDFGNIKGAAFREFLVYYSRSISLTRVRDAVARTGARELSPDRADFGILQNTWYRAELVHAILDRLMEGFNEAELAVLAQAGANHVMGVTLRGIYKTLFSLVASPERYARHIPKLWRVHYDNGEPAVLSRGPSEHHITFMAWRSHHPLACRLNMAAALPIYQAMGCRDVHWHRTHCQSMGGSHCTCIVTWRAR